MMSTNSLDCLKGLKLACIARQERLCTTNMFDEASELVAFCKEQQT